LTIRLQLRVKNAYYNAIWKVLPVIKLILKYLKKQKKIYNNFSDIIDSVDNIFYEIKFIFWKHSRNVNNPIQTRQIDQINSPVN